jgi:hypothetical protein
MVYQMFDLKITRMFCQWFGFKTTRTVFSGLASKLVAMVSPALTLKPVAQVFWFGY